MNALNARIKTKSARREGTVFYPNLINQSNKSYNSIEKKMVLLPHAPWCISGGNGGKSNIQN